MEDSLKVTQFTEERARSDEGKPDPETPDHTAQDGDNFVTK